VTTPGVLFTPGRGEDVSDAESSAEDSAILSDAHDGRHPGPAQVPRLAPGLLLPPPLRPRRDLTPIPHVALTFAADRRGGLGSRSGRGAIPPAHRPRWHPVEREYPSLVKGAWPWLASGVLAIGIGLAVWFTAFVLVHVGAVIVVVGIMKLVRSRTAASPRSN
jgi:hypothetical protein